MIRAAWVLVTAGTMLGCQATSTLPDPAPEEDRGTPLSHPRTDHRIVTQAPDDTRIALSQPDRPPVSPRAHTSAPQPGPASTQSPSADSASDAAAQAAATSGSEDASSASPDASGSTSEAAAQASGTSDAGADACTSPSGDAQAGQTSPSGAASPDAPGEATGLIKVEADTTAATTRRQGSDANSQASQDHNDASGEPGSSQGTATPHADVTGVIDLATGRTEATDPDTPTAPAWLTRPGAAPEESSTPTTPGEGGGELGRGTGASSGESGGGSAGADAGTANDSAISSDATGTRRDPEGHQQGDASTANGANGEVPDSGEEPAEEAAGTHQTYAGGTTQAHEVSLGGLAFDGNDQDTPLGRRQIDDQPLVADHQHHQDATPEPPDPIVASLQGTWRMVPSPGTAHDVAPDFAPGGATHRYLGIDPAGHRLVVMLVWDTDAQIVMTGTFTASVMPGEIDIHVDDEASSRFPTQDMTLPGGGRLIATADEDRWTVPWSRTDTTLRLGDRLYIPVDPSEVHAWHAHQVRGTAQHPGPDRAFTESIDTAAPTEDAPTVDFFGVQSEGRWVCYIVDRSGSMGEDGKIGRLRSELSRSIRQLDREVSFAVVFFSGQAHVIHEGWTGARADRAATIVRDLHGVGPAGGTEPAEAFVWAMTMLDPRPDTIFFMTDGHVSTGDLPGLLRRLNTGSARTRIHTIGFGDKADVGLLTRIAREHGGVHTHVP